MPHLDCREVLYRVLPLLIAGLPGIAAAEADAARLARADEVIRTEMQAQRIPGVAVGIVEHGQVVLVRGYGYANVEHRVPVTADTVFQAGSIGKQFTAAAVMLLVEEGRLSLDDSVRRFVAEAPATWSGIRIRHLLTHTSGISDYRTEALPADVRKAYTQEELVQMACSVKLLFPPGERFSYSNPGYLILGAIIDRITGRHYSELLHDRVFVPLGMKSAREIDDADIIMNRAAGYRLRNGELANQEWMAPENNRSADGSLYLSINDMIAWDRGLREGRVLSASSWRTVYTPVRLNSGKTYPYGFGWGVETVGGQRRLAHNGGTQGFVTHISRYLGDELTIIVFTNLAVGDPARIARHVAAILSDRLPLPTYAPIRDTEPARRASLERLIRLGRAGELTAADLPHIRSGFGPDIPAEYRDTLENLGGLKNLMLVSRETLGDDESSEYLADFANGRQVVTYTVDPSGGTVDFDISEPD